LVATLNQLTSELVACGLALHQRGDFTGAETYYRQILAREPQHADALHLLGVLKGQQGDYTVAARLIEEAISLKPRVSAYHNNLGNLLIKSGDTAAAEKSYRRALRVDPQNADAHLNLGKLQFTNGDRDARRSLKTAQRLSPHSVEAQMSVGRLEEQEGNLLVALDCYRSAAKLAPSLAPAHLAIGNALLLLDRTHEAEESYSTALRLDPSNCDAYFNLANVIRADGRVLEAIALYRTALNYAPKGACSDIRNNLGLALSELGQHEDARTMLKQAVESNSNSSDAWFNLAKQAVIAGDHATAKNYLSQAISIDASHTGAHLQLGDLLLADGSLQEATAMHRKVTEISPDDAVGWSHLGATLVAADSIDDAEAAFRKATLLAPKSEDVFFNLGRHLSVYGDEDEAIEALRHALSLNPTNAAAYTQLGYVAQNRGEFQAAVGHYRKSLEFCSTSSIAKHNLGLVLSSLGHADGLDLLAQTVSEEPESAEFHWNLGEKLLLHQRFSEGLREYEWRKRVGRFTSQHLHFNKPEWDGAPLHGETILLYAEQGQGDTIQFTRYAELVAQRGGRVVLEVQRSLQRLLAELPCVAECVAQGDSLPEFSTFAALMSLPYIFDTSALTIPPPSPFFAEKFATSPDRKRALQVGLVWAGNKRDKRDRLRSTKLDQWSELATIKGVEFTSLQIGEPADQIDWPSTNINFVRGCSSVEDFADTAAIMACLDLVITVDTAVAHLAGTMGKLVWILLYDPVDWRWGLEGEHSAWYPSATLFRQHNQEGWRPVIQRVASRLSDFADASRATAV
jgi:tetratricopeptide (TPR) repeat protein